MFCKWCGMESVTTDQCSWCHRVFSTAPTGTPDTEARHDDLHDETALPDSRTESVKAPPDDSAMEEESEKAPWTISPPVPVAPPAPLPPPTATTDAPSA